MSTTLTKLRQGLKQDAPGRGYYKELERIIRELQSQVVALTPASALTVDSAIITVDTINITSDQVTI